MSKKKITRVKLSPELKRKYYLYEQAVQCTDIHFNFFRAVYREWNEGRLPRSLREDFSASFLMATEWVRLHPQNTALALDIDPIPLAYGFQAHWKRLSANEKKRLKVLEQNVLTTTKPKSDLQIAGNFSFYFLKEWDVLVEYFKHAFKSLTPNGCFILEMAGGPGFVKTAKEQVLHKRAGKPWFTYYWDQKSFDPVTHEGHFAIHFHFPNGKKMKNAFSYGWRIWTIPEVLLALKHAGFKKTAVYWEKEDKHGAGTGEFKRVTKATNDECWISYVVGIR